MDPTQDNSGTDPKTTGENETAEPLTIPRRRGRPKGVKRVRPASPPLASTEEVTSLDQSSFTCPNCKALFSSEDALKDHVCQGRRVARPEVPNRVYRAKDATEQIIQIYVGIASGYTPQQQEEQRALKELKNTIGHMRMAVDDLRIGDGLDPFLQNSNDLRIALYAVLFQLVSLVLRAPDSIRRHTSRSVDKLEFLRSEIRNACEETDTETSAKSDDKVGSEKSVEEGLQPRAASNLAFMDLGEISDVSDSTVSDVDTNDRTAGDTDPTRLGKDHEDHETINFHGFTHRFSEISQDFCSLADTIADDMESAFVDELIMTKKKSDQMQEKLLETEDQAQHPKTAGRGDHISGDKSEGVKMKYKADAGPSSLPHGHGVDPKVDETSDPISERRSLKKCSQCRTNRKRCLPIGRIWPEKCIRCLHSGYQCSPPMLKRDDPRLKIQDIKLEADLTTDNRTENKFIPPSPPFKANTKEKQKIPNQSFKIEAGFSVPELLQKLGISHLAQKEVARVEREHVCYVAAGDCDLCSYLKNLRDSLSDSVKAQIKYVESIADDALASARNHGPERYRSSKLEVANEIYSFLSNMNSRADELPLDSTYKTVTMRRHIVALKMREDWIQAERLLENLARSEIRDPDLFVEYMDCLEHTSKLASDVIGERFRPGRQRTECMSSEFSLPTLQRAISYGIAAPRNLGFKPDRETVDYERDVFGRGPLLVAALYGRLDWCKLLVENNAKLDEIDLSGHMALELACYKGHKETAHYLMDQGAEINPKLFTFSASPLHAAVRGGDLTIVKELVMRGAGLDIRTVLDDCTPLDWANDNGPFDIKEFLSRETLRDAKGLLDLTEEDFEFREYGSYA